MDPAFSLADELADLHHPHHDQHEFDDGDDGELQFHPHHHHHHHHSAYSLDDEFAHGGGAGMMGLEAELEGLHLEAGPGRGHDLASELMGGEAGGSLAAELDPEFADRGTADGARYSTAAHGGSASPDRAASPAPASASTSVPHLPPTDITDTLEATQAFLARLSRLSSSSTTAKPLESSAGFEGEDTANLESAAASYLKLVSQCSMEREAQLRELRDLDRRLERSTGPLNPSWSDRASTSIPEESFSPPASPTSSRHGRTTSLSSDTTVTLRTVAPLVDTSLFAPLYTSTSSLLTSLTSLHEHAQVAKGSTADAARKLKSAKGLIAQWKAEMQSAEQSELWIAAHSDERAERERKGGVWVREQVEWCRKRWEEAEGRAGLLLTPVSIAL
ncbi:hypothetical protein EX895_002111 [Sporisorium graminicola]|uniref:Uncharacterized protein n=1 Tax=Sporisorium graminicola TaxID=280036 RepID=A0A4U7KWK8_9BASI|nr:hypothetical protein EX895_002111 [Sporisorium graminicola]TKY88870.1 hypothetical protein EX895_002111 [Sporisorium graminicola]